MKWGGAHPGEGRTVVAGSAEGQEHFGTFTWATGARLCVLSPQAAEREGDLVAGRAEWQRGWNPKASKELEGPSARPPLAWLVGPSARGSVDGDGVDGGSEGPARF